MSVHDNVASEQKGSVLRSTKTISGSIYQWVEEDLRRRVSSGRWQSGLMIPSRRDLAKEYGVDLRTVQRAIEALLQDGTLVAHGGRGTFVQSTAGVRLPGGAEILQNSAPVIAVVRDQAFAPSQSGLPSVFQTIEVGIQNTLRGYRIINFNIHASSVDESLKLESDAFHFIETENAAGALIYPAGGKAAESQLLGLLHRRIPIVTVDRHPGVFDCDFVGVDNVHGGRDAVQYLLSLGHRRIAFLAPDEEVSSIDDRLKGYRSALARAGLPAAGELEFLLNGKLTYRLDGLTSELSCAVKRMKAMEERPTALFAVNDVIAYHAITALLNEGLRVPEDMSVIGFDDIDRYSPRAPFLTTMRQPFDAISEQAAELLLERIRSRSDGERIGAYHTTLLSATLVVRESCRAVSSA